MVSCGPSPSDLAAKSVELHRQLKEATNEADSAAIYREISYLESQARDNFNKQELKEYERLAHPHE